MDSPADSPIPAERGRKPLEQITFRFCSECSNMLYPKEDEYNRELMFSCRTCNYSEKATSSCIFRNVLNNAAGETAGVTQDVGSDPTVCASSVASTATGDDSMLLHFGCDAFPIIACLCCGRIIDCEVCKEHPASFVHEPVEHDSPMHTGRSSYLDEVDLQSAIGSEFSDMNFSNGDIASWMAQAEDSDLMDCEDGVEERINEENTGLPNDKTHMAAC